MARHIHPFLGTALYKMNVTASRSQEMETTQGLSFERNEATLIHLTRNHLTNQDDEKYYPLVKVVFPIDRLYTREQVSTSRPVRRPAETSNSTSRSRCMERSSQKEQLLPSREYQSRKIF